LNNFSNWVVPWSFLSWPTFDHAHDANSVGQLLYFIKQSVVQHYYKNGITPIISWITSLHTYEKIEYKTIDSIANNVVKFAFNTLLAHVDN
jgi:hypothetical protein